MDGTLLLAGTSSPILDALTKRASAAKLLVATEEAGEREDRPENAVQWNRRSPIAARTLVLHALSQLSSLDNVIMVYSAERSQAPFHEQSATAFEHRIDSELKGYLFLVRELIIHFTRVGGGSIGFVLHDPNGDTVDPVGAAMVSAYKAMAQSLFVLYQNEPIVLRGFSSESDKVAEFAEFVWATVRDRADKSTSRWNRFGGRGSLFSFGRG